MAQRTHIRRVRMSGIVPTKLTSRERMVYEDRAGNRLYAKKADDPRNKVQWSAKNAEGRYVREKDVISLVNKLKRSLR